MMTENKKGRSYNQTALILLSVILAPLLLCGGCVFLWFHPWVTWFHANEMQTVLDNYEQVRSAVFDGDEQPENLRQISVETNLEQLQKTFTNPNSLDEKYAAPQSINITEVREYEGNCSVVIVNPYFGRSEVGFILIKINGTWKVQRIVNDVNEGLVGILPLTVCKRRN